jgi:hypothetical protein
MVMADRLPLLLMMVMATQIQWVRSVEITGFPFCC